MLGGGEIARAAARPAAGQLGRRPVRRGAARRVPAQHRLLRLLPRPGAGGGVRPDHPRGDGQRRTGDHRRAFPAASSPTRPSTPPRPASRPWSASCTRTRTGTGRWSAGPASSSSARFGHQSHLTRLAELRHPAADRAARHRAGEPAPVAAAKARRVLMVSDNGAGMGHLSRLMAIARRLPGRPGGRDRHPVVRAPRSPTGRASSPSTSRPARCSTPAGRAGPRSSATACGHLIELHGRGRGRRQRAARRHRRGRPRPPRGHLGVGAAGDVAARRRRRLDRRAARSSTTSSNRASSRRPSTSGPTVADRANAHPVAPITFLDAAELLDAAAARTRAGARRPAGRAVAARRRQHQRHLLAGRPDRRTCSSTASSWCWPSRPSPPSRCRRCPGAHVVKLYPVSRYLRAFDLTVSAAGYNSFHEQLGFGVPTVFLPNTADQAGRSGRPGPVRRGRRRRADRRGSGSAELDGCSTGGAPGRARPS